MKMGQQEEEVDGNVVAEEPRLGYYASHRFATIRRNTRKPLLGINKRDPHIYRGSVNRLKHGGQGCTTSSFPPFFGQSEATSVSPSDDVITRMLN